jgi:CHAT domain-containing protein
VLRHQGGPVGVDLGPAAIIDTQIDALRQALRDPNRADVAQLARAVDLRVMDPLRPILGDASRLLISPDGELNLVPFEAFMDAQGRYLIERYAVSYLTSGRDLLRMQVARESRTPPVVFADPYFGEPPANVRPPAAPGRGLTTSNRSSESYFAPLAGTAEEARAIKALFPDATLLTRRQATKAALQQLDAPRLLHIASHGFFLQDAGSDATENPLLRSGLALAGANLPHTTRDPGILTASEASGLNLWGTRLVTLSACDTGLGEVRNGEGVYGLRRAFVLAGAETLVMSLWAVSDYVTRETMTTYYQGLRAGLGRGDALRQAKLAILHRRGREHPFYWASFIQSGEWASLDGKR